MSSHQFKRVPFTNPAITNTTVNRLFIHRVLPVDAKPADHKLLSLRNRKVLYWQNRLKLLLTRLAQSFRLMVGVHDYQSYVQHMQQHHPQLQVMTEKQFHRHCLEARYPSQGGKVGKCPC